MAGLQLEIEGRVLSQDDIFEVWNSEDAFDFEQDVLPGFIDAIHCIPDEDEAKFFASVGSFTAADAKVLDLYSPDLPTGESDDYWRAPADVVRAMRRLADACRQRLPGTAMAWRQAAEIADPIEETDGGRRVVNDDRFYDHEPGDWASVCATDLERCANLIEELERRGETQVKLLMCIT